MRHASSELGHTYKLNIGPQLDLGYCRTEIRWVTQIQKLAAVQIKWHSLLIKEPLYPCANGNPTGHTEGGNSIGYSVPISVLYAYVRVFTPGSKYTTLTV